MGTSEKLNYDIGFDMMIEIQLLNSNNKSDIYFSLRWIMKEKEKENIKDILLSIHTQRKQTSYFWAQPFTSKVWNLRFECEWIKTIHPPPLLQKVNVSYPLWKRRGADFLGRWINLPRSRTRADLWVRA